MNNNNFLVHFGIKGQKWGKKNGPPYPLDFSKLSSEEKQYAKNEVINRGDVKTAHKNRNDFTDQEIRDTISRFDVYKKLSEYNDDKKSLIDKVEKYANKLGKLVDSGEKAVRGYNFVVKISNSLLDTDYKYIENGSKKKKASYKNSNLKEILDNIDKYDDDQVANMSRRMKNIEGLKKGIGYDDEDDKEK